MVARAEGLSNWAHALLGELCASLARHFFARDRSPQLGKAFTFQGRAFDYHAWILGWGRHNGRRVVSQQFGEITTTLRSHGFGSFNTCMDKPGKDTEGSSRISSWSIPWGLRRVFAAGVCSIDPAQPNRVKVTTQSWTLVSRTPIETLSSAGSNDTIPSP